MKQFTAFLMMGAMSLAFVGCEQHEVKKEVKVENKPAQEMKTDKEPVSAP